MLGSGYSPNGQAHDASQEGCTMKQVTHCLLGASLHVVPLCSQQIRLLIEFTIKCLDLICICSRLPFS